MIQAITYYNKAKHQSFSVHRAHIHNYTYHQLLSTNYIQYHKPRNVHLLMFQLL